MIFTMYSWFNKLLYYQHLNFTCRKTQQYLIVTSNSPLKSWRVELTHFWSIFLFYTPWKHWKNRYFLVFSWSAKWQNWLLAIVNTPLKLNPSVASFSIFYPLRTQEVFREYQMGTLARNGLKDGFRHGR